MASLPSVPPEILTHVAGFLACGDPFQPPHDLLALQATSRHFFLSLNCHLNPEVWAAAFRFRFDHRAVLRRNFRPTGRDYKDQLCQYFGVLAALRRRDVDLGLEDDGWRIVYMMLMDNNGKNRAQLEQAGIDALIRTYMHTRLWADAEENDGWPRDSPRDVFVIWSMWMLTTLAKLQAEDIDERERIVTRLLPFVVNAYRYHQAEAPPSHFHLPLPSNGVTDFAPTSLPSAHGPYPIYASPSNQASVPYFGAIPVISPPPITVAAKLLYFARREIIPFNIPPHVPATRAQAPPSNAPQPTREDFIEINAYRGAEPQPCITWDWEQGHRLINGAPDTSDYDHSIRWDQDYWRRLLCGDAWQPEPKWRPGNVYVPGSMDGLWQGRLIFPMEQAMRHLIEHAAYPGQNFSEMALSLTHQPLFMRLKENHALYSTPPTRHHHVPFPPRMQQTNDDLNQWSDLSMRNAWFPGVLGNLDFYGLRNPPYNSRVYTAPGERRNILVSLDGHVPPPGTILNESPYPQERNGYLYSMFDRRIDAAEREQAAMQGIEYQHKGHEDCPTCREREEAIRRGAEMDEDDHDMIARAYEENWMEIDRVFEEVGLGRNETRPVDDDDAMDEDEDEEEEQTEFMRDLNADLSDARPVRRATDRAKIAKCDGIQDIIFSGATDRRHGQAWNHFTFYGRVRPWDGLIGILRRSYWPRQNFIFFYGYLVGSETFVGNWKFAATDPHVPTWESAFVMSRRKDDQARMEDDGSN